MLHAKNYIMFPTKAHHPYSNVRSMQYAKWEQEHGSLIALCRKRVGIVTSQKFKILTRIGSFIIKIVTFSRLQLYRKRMKIISHQTTNSSKLHAISYKRLTSTFFLDKKQTFIRKNTGKMGIKTLVVNLTV